MVIQAPVPSSGDFLAIYPRFKDVPAETISYWLAFCARAYVPASLWGVHRYDGTMLATAHFLEMEWFQSAETAGAAVAIASGGGGRSATPQNDEFLLTTWGRRFKQLQQSLEDGTVSQVLDDIVDGNYRPGIGFIL